MDAPAEIQKLLDCLSGLPGVTEVDCNAIPLEDFDCEHISLLPYGDLPHAALQRTQGGLAGEVLGQFFIRFDKTEGAWDSIELLSWQVRDCSRGGNRIQMRSLGLPPKVGDQVQLGKTLRFVIEIFQDGMESNSGGLLKSVDEFADDLQDSLRIYELM